MMEIMSFFLRRCFLAMFSGMDIGVQGGLKIPRLTATMKYFVEQRKRYRSCTPVFELNDSSSPIVIIDICNIKDIALLHSRAFLREMLLPKAAICLQTPPGKIFRHIRRHPWTSSIGQTLWSRWRHRLNIHSMALHSCIIAMRTTFVDCC
jgi:hypothetical protein